MPFCEPDTFGYFRKKFSIFLRKAQFFWKVVRGVFTEVEQQYVGETERRSVSAYLVIALLSRNTQTLSSPGISIYPDILWMTSEYNLLSISHRALERPSWMLPLDV